MRDRALEALGILSLYDNYFLSSLRDNPEPTLWNYGFALSPDEMQEVRQYLTDHAEDSDQDIKARLETLDSHIADVDFAADAAVQRKRW